MRRTRTRVLVILLVIIVFFLVLFSLSYILTANPRKIIEKKLGFSIPESSSVENYNYNRLNGFFEAKVLLSRTDMESLRNNLRQAFNYETNSKFAAIPNNFKPKWWDLSNSNILTAFGGAEIGPANLLGIVSLSVARSAFLVEQNDGKYFLFLDFVILPRDVIFK